MVILDLLKNDWRLAVTVQGVVRKPALPRATLLTIVYCAWSGMIIWFAMKFRSEPRASYVYSISSRGAAELAGLGEYYTGLPRRPVDGQLPKTVYHAIELNEIHLALKRSEQLVRWTPDTEIRSRNEFTDSGYKKDYDAVVTVCINGSERTFALEYERTAKARKEYLQIRNDIEAETTVGRFLYVVPNYDLLSYVATFFATSRRAIYFGLFPDFLNRLLEMPLRSAQPGPLSTLRDVLWVT